MIKFEFIPAACSGDEFKLQRFACCKDKADNRGVAEGEDGYFNGTTGLPVGIHSVNPFDVICQII